MDSPSGACELIAQGAKQFEFPDFLARLSPFILQQKRATVCHRNCDLEF
jgi:hypothetical protein